MTMVRVAAALLTMSAICASADDNVQATTGLSPEDELISLDDAWVEAEVHGDRKALEQILHEDFLVTYASGRTVDRTSFIDAITSSKPAPFKVIHEVVRVQGDTALVIDKSESGKTKFTWVAIRRDGHWRVISETASRVEAP